MSTSERKILTFDCYNTLVDMAPVDAAFGSIARQYSLHNEASGLRATFCRIAHDLMYGTAFFTLKELLARAIHESLRSFGVTAAPHDAATLVECYRALAPFADVPAVLEQLAAQFDLCIMSNSDEDIISSNARSIGVPFRHIFTAQQLRCYKPTLSFFEHVQRSLNLDPQHHTHIAAGFWWDIMPGKHLHWRRIWVNRQGQQGDEQYQPYAEVQDFRAVPEALDI